MANKPYHGTPDGSHIIYRPYIRLKDGRIIYAKTYGKKAFRIVVTDNKKGQPPQA